MFNGLFHIREPKNEPVLGYAPGSEERAELKAELERMLHNPVEVPCIIGGREVPTGDLVEMKPPHNLQQIARALPPRERQGGRDGDRRRQRGEDRLERDAVVVAGHGPAQGRGAAGRQVPPDAERRHHAQHEQDLPSGRDRLRLRADRLLALQPLLHDAGLRRPAASPPRTCSTTWSTARWRDSSSRSRRSTSRRSRATCPPPRR